MVYQDLIYAIENGNIAVITLNRPEAMNALTHRSHTEMAEAIDQADKDDAVRVIVITGAGRGFCAGDDVKTIFLGGDDSSPEERERAGREQHLAYLQRQRQSAGGGVALLSINKPTIAAVNGAAVGYGCDTAMMCDMRIASERARFGEIFLRVGLIPDEGQLILPRLVGMAKAYELTLTTDIVDAEEAHRIGLVNRVVPHEELMPATLELAAKIASKPPISVRLAKEGIRRGLNIPIEEWKEWYSFAQRFCFGTEDHQEGARAFVEKREPEFKGR